MAAHVAQTAPRVLRRMYDVSFIGHRGRHATGARRTGRSFAGGVRRLVGRLNCTAGRQVTLAAKTNCCSVRARTATDARKAVDPAAAATDRRPSRLEHDLHALVLLVLEHVVASGASSRDMRCVITKLGSMSPARCARAAGAGSGARGTGRSDRQRAVHDGADRELVHEAAVDAHDRNRAAVAAVGSPRAGRGRSVSIRVACLARS